MTDYWQVSTATETQDAALALASSAIEARLAASAQVIGPVKSVFWHLGQLGTGEEWIVLLKTTNDRYPTLEQHLIERHPWDNPEVSAVPIAAGSERCLQWLRDSVSEPA